MDFDGHDQDDFVDDIFINMILHVSRDYTSIEEYTGELGSVKILARFRVRCQQDFFGVDCYTFCIPQNDSNRGHYLCDQSGNIVCLEGFKNAQNSCRDSKL